MQPDYWDQAILTLAQRDPVLNDLIQNYPGIALESRGNAFATLARSIVGQQISVKAAESVWQKLLSHIQEATPVSIHLAEAGKLRECGLSGRKVEYLQDLARKFLCGELDATHWHTLEDEELIKDLVRVKGIGRWTAEMFLIFHLMRPDVLPLDDIGLQRAMARKYNLNQPLSKPDMQKIAHNWQPWRSVATWYLWRSLDPLPVEY